MWAQLASKPAGEKENPSAKQIPADTHAPTAVIDANALINGNALGLFRLAQRFYTIQEVLEEIRDKQSRQYLQGLPFTVEVKECSEESLSAGVFVCTLALLVMLTRLTACISSRAYHAAHNWEPQLVRACSPSCYTACLGAHAHGWWLLYLLKGAESSHEHFLKICSPAYVLLVSRASMPLQTRRPVSVAVMLLCL